MTRARRSALVAGQNLEVVFQQELLEGVRAFARALSVDVGLSLLKWLLSVATNFTVLVMERRKIVGL
jgi:hypothetical protein